MIETGQRIARVVILMGQSNAGGASIVNDLAPEYRKVLGCRIWLSEPGTTVGGRLEVLEFGRNNKPDLAVADPVILSEGYRSHTLGPEMSMATTLTKVFTTEELFMLKVAIGGTSFGTAATPGRWFPETGDLTIETWRQFDQLKAHLINDLGFLKVDVVLIVMAIGEQDASGAVPGAETEFAVNATNWVTEAQFRTDHPEVLVSMMYLHKNGDGTFLTTVRAQQVTWEAAHVYNQLINIDHTQLQDSIHLDWRGQIHLGHSSVHQQFGGLKTTQVFEEYSLGDIKRRLFNEFGLDDRDTERVVDLVNDGLQKIIDDRNGGWPWQLKEFAIDVETRRVYENVVFLTPTNQGTATRRRLIVPESDTPHVIMPRDMLQVGEAAGSLTQGFMVVDVSHAVGGAGYIVDIDAQHNVEELVFGFSDFTTITVTKGYFELPDDFLSMRNVFNLQEPNRAVVYRDPVIFEEIRRQQRIASGSTMLYTIKMDPLDSAYSWSSGRQFMCLYPYQSARTSIQGLYTAQPPKLVLDGDVPPIPRQYRYVLYQQAALLVAGQLKESQQLAYYIGQAEQGLQKMNSQYQFASDSSDLKAVGAHPLNTPSLPAGYEDWRDI